MHKPKNIGGKNETAINKTQDKWDDDKWDKLDLMNYTQLSKRQLGFN